MNNMLQHARAEVARWQKIVALLEAAPEAAASAPSPSSKAEPKGKGNPASRSYWTPARRKAMSDKIKALARKKAQGEGKK